MSTLAFALGSCFGLGVVLVVVGLRPRPVARIRPSSPKGTSPRRPTPSQAMAVAAVGLGTLLVTGWPVLAASSGAAVCWWLSGRRNKAEVTAIERIEALATWAEMLRDAAGTPRGIEGVLVSTAATAPAPIRSTVVQFADRLVYEPLDVALPDLAEKLAHPVGDQIVASIGLTATSGAREIRAVLDDLASAARDEAGMLRRLEVSRQRPRSDMRQVILIVAITIGSLSLVGRDFLAPYDTLGGQVVLAMAGVLWIGGFVWMSRLGRVESPRRFLVPREAMDQ